MKDNIRNSIFSISIFYSIIVIILMLFSLFNSVTTIELNDMDENKTKIKELKNELELLEQNDCTNTINSMIKYYETTSYNGEVNIKEMYLSANEISFLPLYAKARENCNLSDRYQDKYNLPAKILTVSLNQDKIFQNYYFQYELSIKDIYTRYLMESYTEPTLYNISKRMELEVISSLIEIEKERVDIDE